jgi:replicative DNA helicase
MNSGGSVSSQVPPHSIEAEQAVLGGVLLKNETMPWDLKATDFYRTAHGLLFDAFRKMLAKNTPLDLVTVVDYLRETGGLEKIGGTSYLVELTTQVPSLAHVNHYADQVKKLAGRRRLINSARQLEQSAYHTEGDVSDLLGKFNQGLLHVNSTGGLYTSKQICLEFIKELEKKHRDGGVFGLETGLYEIDEFARPMASDLVIIAGRPGMGKSTVLQALMQHISIVCGKPGMLFSLEMTRSQYVARMASSLSSIDFTKIHTGRMQESDWGPLSQAATRISDAPFVIDDTPGVSLEYIKLQAQKYVLSHGPKSLSYLGIDHLQLMNHVAGHKNSTRTEDVGATTRGLKSLAKELDVPVIVLSQFNRKCEERKPPIPIVSDLRDSGEIEQDADMIWLLYREEHYKKKDTSPEKQGVLDIMVAKQRNGRTGDVSVSFQGKYCRVANLEDRRF